MKTNLDTELTYFILGLPNNGTTIVASFFNSLEDGFCICEPHWYVERGHPIEAVGDGCCGKVAHLWDQADVREPREIYPGFILPAVTIGGYHLGGYKETWRNDKLGNQLLRDHVARVDFFVVVHRHASEFLMDLGSHPKAVNISYPAFRLDPLDCANTALAGRFEIEGPVVLQPTGWAFGDPRANQSTEVK
jgi:hypothetical protein